jgi:hypothetical protein
LVALGPDRNAIGDRLFLSMVHSFTGVRSDRLPFH